MKIRHPLPLSVLKWAVVFLALAQTMAFALDIPTTPAAGAIAVGGFHTVALKSDGTVWAWGSNSVGQLGDGTTVDRPAPVQVSGLSGIVAVSAGSSHTVVLKSNGTVYAFGGNAYGQLGDGTNTGRATAVQITGLSGVVAVAAGSGYTLALKSDGTVWTCGYNYYGQLGDGTTTNRPSIVQVAGLNSVVALAAGSGHAMALRGDGTVWGWGDNSYGQLGDGTWNNWRTTAGPVTGLGDVKAVSAGGYHTVAVKTGGAVWAWGLNSTGQLGDGTTTFRATAVPVNGLSGEVVAVAAGFSHTAVLKSDGTLWTWGSNSYGELGDGTTTQRIFPMAVSDMGDVVAVAANTQTVALKNNGTVLAWGRNSTGQLGVGIITNKKRGVQVTDLTDITAIATGSVHSVAIKSDHTVWTWGSNTYGQLGNGTTTAQNAAVQASGLNDVVAVAAAGWQTIALKSDGTVWAWGDNAYGQLGDGTTTQRKTAVPVSNLSGVVAVAAGWHHTVALKSDGTVWAWGNNGNGQLGDGTFTYRKTAVQVGGLSGVVAISAGGAHTVALMADGTVWNWGDNSYGQLGDGLTIARKTPYQVSEMNGIIAVSAGYGHTLALKSDGTVWAWGSNNYGQLGDGTVLLLQTKPVQVSGLSGAVAIAAGSYHTVAQKSDGTLRAWGWNYYGELGDGTTTKRNTPVEVIGQSGVTSIKAENSHTLVLKNDGSLRGWGIVDFQGQLAFSPNQAAIRLIPSAEDTDQDGMSDMWEMQYFGSLTHSGGADMDGDGLTDIQEFRKGSDPTQADADGDRLTDFVDSYPNDFYNNVTPSLSVVGGDNQTAAPNTFCALPLDVATWNGSATAPLVNAPVTFSVTSGEGSLAASITGDLLQSLTVRADQDGTAQVHFKHGGSFGASSAITVTAGNAQLVMHSATTSKQDQTITFADPGPQTFGTPLALSATASSGLPVSFVATSGPVTIANGVATFTGIGSVTITAGQAGDDSFSAAPGVARTFEVVAANQPTVTLSPTTVTVNVGEAVAFTASGGLTSYVWDGSVSGSGATQSVTFNSVGVFNVSVYAKADGNYAQSNTAAATITVCDSIPPVIAPMADLVVEAVSAAGAAVSFSSSATDAVDGPVAVTASQSPGSTFPLGTTTVTLTAMDAAGNSATRSFKVTVRDTTAPVISIPTNQTVGATGSDGTMVEFTTNASDLVDETVAVSASISSGSKFPIGTTTVTLTAIDASGNTATGSFTVTVQTAAPVIITQPESQTVVLGQSVTLTVGATGFPVPTYQWKFWGQIIPGATSASYMIPSAQSSDAGSYTVAVMNMAGSAVSSFVNLQVVVPATITTQPSSVTINTEGKVVFQVIATGSGVLSFQWYRDGEPITGAISSAYTLDPAQYIHAGSYYVVVSNPYGTVTSATAILTVNVKPTITAQPQSLVVAVGSNVTFAVGTAGTTPMAYQWKKGSTAIAGATDATYSIPSAQTTDAGSFSVVVSNPAGSVTSSAATLSVKIPPTITTQPVNATVTAGKNATFRVVASGSTMLTYQWYFNGVAISGAGSASYTVTAAQSANVGTYSVVVANAVGSATSAGATLTVNYPVVITAQPVSQSITVGSLVTFGVEVTGTAPFTYQWRRNSVAIVGAMSSSYTNPSAQTAGAGNYTVVVTNVVGSVTSSIAVLKVNIPPAITTQPIGKTVTTGTTATFKVVATGTATLTYQWKLNGMPIDGATAASYSAVASVATTGTYSVVVSNVAGSVTSSAAVLTLK